jgi:2,3-bisphosphoglycerate-independent phosphoglycerate mutase
MVGHTANKPAIITAVETVDRELKRVVEAVLDKCGLAIITADHGNAEQNIDEQTGELHTAHTTNLVPFIIASPDLTIQSPAKNPLVSEFLNLRDPSARQNFQNNGKFWLGRDDKQRSLADIAPTILNLFQLKKPASMTGESLVK